MVFMWLLFVCIKYTPTVLILHENENGILECDGHITDVKLEIVFGENFGQLRSEITGIKCIGYAKTHFPTKYSHEHQCTARCVLTHQSMHQTKYHIKLESARANRLISLKLDFMD